MRLKYTFEFLDMGDEIISVPVGKNADQLHGVLKLNKSAKEIIDILQNDTSEDLITKELASKYDVDYKTLYDFVNSTVEKLREYDLIED